MKTKYNVHLHGWGISSYAILRLIGRHNSGKTTVSITDIISLAEAIIKENRSITKTYISYVYDEKNLQLDIKEGENFITHIELVEVYSLEEKAQLN